MIYFCATPIGNLEDITLRVIRILNEADCIYAEDTRHTLKLLNHYKIKKPLIACHEHNETAKADEIVERCLNGDNIAVCTDAGLPGISDPGGIVLLKAIEKNAPYTVLPGANAAITALLLSGFDSNTFYFHGFLSRETRIRKEELKALSTCASTIILYESPKRLTRTFGDLFDCFGERNAALCKEITKIHERVVRGKLSELKEKFEDEKGECVIIIEGMKKDAPEIEFDELIQAMRDMVESGVKTKTAAKLIAANSNKGANELYNYYIKTVKQ